jgi:hypothetical protein
MTRTQLYWTQSGCTTITHIPLFYTTAAWLFGYDSHTTVLGTLMLFGYE